MEIAYVIIIYLEIARSRNRLPNSGLHIMLKERDYSSPTVMYRTVASIVWTIYIWLPYYGIHAMIHVCFLRTVDYLQDKWNAPTVWRFSCTRMCTRNHTSSASWNEAYEGRRLFGWLKSTALHIKKIDLRTTTSLLTTLPLTAVDLEAFYSVRLLTRK